MFLQRLREYADRIALPPYMYQRVSVRYVIHLHANGRYINYVEQERGVRYPVPDFVRSSNIKPKLLADNGEYVLAIPRQKSKPEDVAERHAAFRERVKDCATTTGEPSGRAVS